MTNVFSMKKTVAVAAGLAIAFSAVFVSSVSAQTAAEDLQAQIASLLAMIAGLQAQLGDDTTTTTPTTGGSCTAAQFTLTHVVGDRGGEVMDIQKFLNMDAATMVATSGAGSAGQETSYFGPATKAAVINFQNKYASEVLAPVSLSVGTGYWGSSSRAKANALEIARCAAAPTVPTTPTTPATGDNELTVSAAAQPGNSLAPALAQAVPFTKFTLTAGEEDVMVENVLVELTGLADKVSFDKVMLLDEDGILIGNERSLNSDDQAKIGKNLKVKAGKTKTFIVAATMEASGTVKPGEIAAFSVIAINTDVTVAGSLPITGAQHTINSTLTVAGVNLADNGSTANADLEDTKVKIAVLEIDPSTTEDLRLMTVRLHQNENADLSEALSTVKAKFIGKTYSVDIDGDYLTVDFGSNGVLVESQEDLTITATIVGGASDKIELEVENETDIIAVGDSYGYGAGVTNAAPFLLSVITIQDADVTVNNTTDVSDDKVAAGSDMVDLASFEVDAQGADVTGDLDMTITIGGTAPAAYADAELANVAIYTVDGDRVSDREDFTFTAAGDLVVTFTDVRFNTDADGAVDYVIKGDINKDAITGVAYTVKTLSYTKIETVSGGDVQTTTVTETLNTATQTVESSALDVSIETPDDTSVNGDTNDIIVAEISFDASDSGDDVDVSEIKLAFGVVDTPGVVVADLTDVDQCKLYNGTTEVTSGGEDAAASVTFDVDFTVTKADVTTLVVKCDLSNDFEALDTITVTGISYKGIGQVTTAKVELGTTGIAAIAAFALTNTVVTVTDGAPTLTTTTDDENDNKAVVDTANDVSFGIVDFDAQDAELEIDTVTVTMNATVAAVIDGKMDIFIDGQKVTGESVAVDGTGLIFAFTNLATTVAKDAKVNIEFKADIKTGSTATVNIASVALTTKEAVNPATLALTSPTVATSAAIPEVVAINADTLTVNTSYESDQQIIEFSVKAIGGNVVLTQTTLTSVFNSSMALPNAELKVYNDVNHANEELVVAAAAANAVLATSESFATALTITEGDTYYFVLEADVQAPTGSSATVTLLDALASFTFTGGPSAELVIVEDIKATINTTL